MTKAAVSAVAEKNLARAYANLDLDVHYQSVVRKKPGSNGDELFE